MNKQTESTIDANVNEIEVVVYKKSEAERILNMINILTLHGINNAKIIAEISNILEHPIEVGDK